MQLIKVVSFLIVVFVSSHAQAMASCDTKACTAKVKNLLVFDQDKVHVLLDNSSADRANLNCTMAANQSLYLPTNNTGALDRMYSAILSALMADKETTLRIVDGSNPCTVSYVRAH